MTINVRLDTKNSRVLMSLDGSEGLYWYIYPTLERLAETTGEMVDLHGVATFECGQLLELFIRIEEIVKKLSNEPDSWEIEIPNDVSRGKPNVSTIQRDDSIEKLQQLMSIANDAYMDSHKLVFAGD